MSIHNYVNVLCHACKQKTHLKASVGNEGELQSLVGLLDPVSENTMTNMSVILMFIFIQYIMQLISEMSWCIELGSAQGSSHLESERTFKLQRNNSIPLDETTILKTTKHLLQALVQV